MRPVRYFRKWLRVALRHSFSALDCLSTAVGVVTPLLVKLHPDWTGPMMDLAWQIPLGGCAAFVAARLIAAPYWMHRELEEENLTLRATIARPSLEIGFDENDPECAQYVELQSNHQLREYRLYVINKDPCRTARNVEVSILAVTPPITGFTPLPLARVRILEDGPTPLMAAMTQRLRRNAPPLTIIGHERNTFDLNPGAHRYVQLMRLEDDGVLTFLVAPWTKAVTRLPLQDYRVSLRATASDMPVQLCEVQLTPLPDKRLRLEVLGKA